VKIKAYSPPPLFPHPDSFPGASFPCVGPVVRCPLFRQAATSHGSRVFPAASLMDPLCNGFSLTFLVPFIRSGPQDLVLCALPRTSGQAACVLLSTLVSFRPGGPSCPHFTTVPHALPMFLGPPFGGLPTRIFPPISFTFDLIGVPRQFLGGYSVYHIAGHRPCVWTPPLPLLTDSIARPVDVIFVWPRFPLSAFSRFITELCRPSVPRSLNVLPRVTALQACVGDSLCSFGTTILIPPPLDSFA